MKILITLAILALYRLASHVPVPGSNPEAISQIMQAGQAGGTLVGLLDLLSGGTVSRFSVLAMGVYPYITAQIILQLLVPIIPALKARMEEDPREGQKWMNRWTYILAVPMAALNAVGQINLFNALAPQGVLVIDNFGWTGASLLPSLAIIASMTAGTMFAIWLGELISEYGIRQQGLSLIIFAGIISRIPSSLAALMADQERRVILIVLTLIITTLTIFAIVFVQQGRRNVVVIYKGRRVGNRMSMPVRTTLPLMVNMAGMIPLIFAQSLLTFPAIVAAFFTTSKWEWLRSLSNTVQSLFGGQSDFYWIMYFLFVVGFTFFYTNVLFDQQNYGRNLARAGAEIPNVSPREEGALMQRYLNKVLSRITLPGALFLGLVAILPWVLGKVSGLGQNTELLLVQSAGLLIVVGVVRDIFVNIQAELKTRYDDVRLVR
ncbi:MAG: preprotein translocase subunit SecY [Anaerolineales bacterium]|nr:preprotein translocase subunit SecY [Anaerolineales bacterium]